MRRRLDRGADSRGVKHDGELFCTFWGAVRIWYFVGFWYIMGKKKQ